MAVITFNLPAAQDALARSDEGHDALPGDTELIDALEGWCQQEADRRLYAQHQAEYADWLATQCRRCGPEGASGETCDECFVLVNVRSGCPKCGRFIADAAITSHDVVDPGTYHGVRAVTTGECTRCGTVTDPTWVQVGGLA